MTLAMTVCDLDNNVVHSKGLLCSHYDVCSQNDSVWPHRDLCDLLNDLLCILKMVCVPFAMSVLITINAFWCPHNGFWAITMILCVPSQSLCDFKSHFV